MNNETCIHGGNSPVELLASLHRNQGGTGRHKCPTCAYESGFNIGSSKDWGSFSSYIETINNKESCTHENLAPTDILLSLGLSQGGTGNIR